MSDITVTHKPLYLSEEEALALLDLCVMSRTEMDAIKERAVIKLTCLVRRFFSGSDGATPEEAETPAPTRETPEARCEVCVAKVRRGIPVTRRLHVWRGMNPLRHA